MITIKLLFISVLFLQLDSLLGRKYPKEFKDQIQKYPNIITETSKCLPLKGNYRSPETFVCDPDKLLTVNEIESLNTRINEIKTRINRGSLGSCQREYPRPQVAIALVKGMKIGEQTDPTVLNYASIFAYYLFDVWKLSTECADGKDKVIIFYSKDDGALYTYAGDRLDTKMSVKKIVDVSVKSKPFFNTNIASGLSYMLMRYKNIFSSRDTDF